MLTGIIICMLTFVAICMCCTTHKHYYVQSYYILYVCCYNYVILIVQSYFFVCLPLFLYACALTSFTCSLLLLYVAYICRFVSYTPSCCILLCNMTVLVLHNLCSMLFYLICAKRPFLYVSCYFYLHVHWHCCLARSLLLYLVCSDIAFMCALLLLFCVCAVI